MTGQDPYHNGSAVGLCFSVKKGNDINPSLLNIYKELENCGYTIYKWKEEWYSVAINGKKAADFQKYSKKCFITSHPSPLSAYRGFGKYPAFIGSKIFLEINKYLTSIGKRWDKMVKSIL